MRRYAKNRGFFPRILAQLSRDGKGVGPSRLSAPITMAQRFLVAAAVGAVVAQLEGRTLGLAALAHAVLAMAHLDLVEGTVLVLVVGAAVHRALDAGIGLVDHGCFLLVS